MRVLLLFAHPLADSYASALRDAACAALATGGHEVDLLDLYAEGFDPVMPGDERRAYHDLARNRDPVAGYVERLCSAEALVVISPVWNLGPPAILKGFYDRVFLPGVTFTLDQNRQIAAGQVRLDAYLGIHTYGGPQHLIWLAGDPPRRAEMRLLGGLVRAEGTRRYLALYGMNTATDARRQQFLRRVGRAVSAL